MTLFESLCVFAAIAIISYNYAKKKRLEQEANLQNIRATEQSEVTLLQEELDRRAKIVSRVDAFIKNSKFIEPIAKWRNDNIYKYIFNDGYLYEFEDILAENDQRIGIDEEYLCFKRFCYKRVNNPIEFMQKFGAALGMKQQ